MGEGACLTPRCCRLLPLCACFHILRRLAAGTELVRDVSEEQAAAELSAIRNMWQLAVVYEFLARFKPWLRFTQMYPVGDIEQALVRSPGPGAMGGAAGRGARCAACAAGARLQSLPLQRSAARPDRPCARPGWRQAQRRGVDAAAACCGACAALVCARPAAAGLLAQLHIDLLQGISHSVGPHNWASVLAARLQAEAHAAHLKGPQYAPPFKPQRGREAREYAALGAAQRCVQRRLLLQAAGCPAWAAAAPPACGHARARTHSHTNTPARTRTRARAQGAHAQGARRHARRA
jgi:hypothetical protein